MEMLKKVDNMIKITIKWLRFEDLYKKLLFRRLHYFNHIVFRVCYDLCFKSDKTMSIAIKLLLRRVSFLKKEILEMIKISSLEKI